MLLVKKKFVSPLDPEWLEFVPQPYIHMPEFCPRNPISTSSLPSNNAANQVVK